MSRKGIAVALLSTTSLLIGAAVAADQLFYQGSSFPPPHAKLDGIFAPQPIVPGSTALLVSGGISPDKNHPRYWNNLSLMYQTLKASGWERILVLDGDGGAPNDDQLQRSFLGMFSTGEYRDSPVDLDFDGTGDVVGPATEDALAATLERIGKTLEPGAPFFLFITDHGQLRFDGGLGAVAMLWGEDELTSDELEQMLARTIPEDTWMGIMATQCHGGIFLRDVDRDNTVFMASGWPLWIWSDQDYSVFPFRFAEAMLGADPSTGAALEAPDGPSRAASFREAFAIAADRDHAPEWPISWVSGDESLIPGPF